MVHVQAIATRDNPFLAVWLASIIGHSRMNVENMACKQASIFYQWIVHVTPTNLRYSQVHDIQHLHIYMNFHQIKHRYHQHLHMASISNEPRKHNSLSCQVSIIDKLETGFRHKYIKIIKTILKLKGLKHLNQTS